MKIRNIFVIFIVSGFWHGANWTFIIWGFLNALYFLPLMLFNKNRVNTDIAAKGKFFPSIREFINIIITFSLTLIAWVFFRAESVSEALNYLSIIFSKSLFTESEILPIDFILIILVFLLIEWFNREKLHPLSFSPIKNKKSIIYLRIIGICVLVWAIILWGVFDNKEFIYFQF